MKPPPKQDNYQEAFRHALAAARKQPSERLVALGALPLDAERYELPTLEQVFTIDLETGDFTTSGAEPPNLWWRILTLRYLASKETTSQAPSTAFAEFPDARLYEPVYRGRALGRLCATAGRDRERFLRAGRALAGTPVDIGDEGFLFQPFPRLAITIVWYAGDDEFPSGATILFPKNILSIISTEDMVVLSEQIVGRMQKV